MTQNIVYKRIYESGDTLIPVKMEEVMRYARYGGVNEYDRDAFEALFSQPMRELSGSVSYQVCYRRVPLVWEKGWPVLPFESRSSDLARTLMGSSEIIMFAATIGMAVDREIKRAERTSPTKALIFQAYGAERVESLCDYFCGEIKQEIEAEGLKCTARFSPGYGDVPIDVQREFVSLLDCSRQIGISLNESLLMTPSKSVTAIFGIGKNVCADENRHDCSKCNLRGKCAFSREQ